MKALLAVLLLAFANFATAQNTRVVLDTDRGPMLLELESATPITTANFLRYVDAGHYDSTLLNRVVRNFIVQGGGFKDTGADITRFPAIASERKGQVGTGDRSERIRTYNFHEGRITDHRIKLSLYQLPQMMDGELDELLGALVTHYRAETLKGESEAVGAAR